jgi:hypothetical protein
MCDYSLLYAVNMNHPEFSNKKIRDDFFMSKYNYRTVYALFLASLENRAGGIF